MISQWFERSKHVLSWDSGKSLCAAPKGILRPWLASKDQASRETLASSSKALNRSRTLPSAVARGSLGSPSRGIHLLSFYTENGWWMMVDLVDCRWHTFIYPKNSQSSWTLQFEVPTLTSVSGSAGSPSPASPASPSPVPSADAKVSTVSTSSDSELSSVSMLNSSGYATGSATSARSLILAKVSSTETPIKPGVDGSRAGLRQVQEGNLSTWVFGSQIFLWFATSLWQWWQLEIHYKWRV